MLQENAGLTLKRIGQEGTPPKPRCGDGRVLAALMLLAALLRFSWLGRPGIWGDEAATFARVCGSWKDLMWALQEMGGFAPLHYELYWALARCLKLTPICMRAVPAVSGVLMVPAVWFVARQIVSRRAALLASAFAASSAYLCVYSRDAKMYMHFWLFCTLSCGCFLSWIRTDKRLSWWLWILCSLAMVGLHAPGLLLLLVQVLWCLASWIPQIAARKSRINAPSRWRPALRQPIMLLLGLGLIALGPLIYYQSFNRFAQRVEQRGWAASQLNWVDSYNQGRDGADLVLYTASAFLMSWEWPRRPDFLAHIDPSMLSLGKGLTIGLLTAIGLGALPWGRRRRQSAGEATSPLLQQTTAAKPAPIGPETPPEHSTDPTANPVPWWQSALWLGLWLGVPAYAIYCVSTEAFWGPVQAWHAIVRQLSTGAWGWTLPLLVLVAALCTGQPISWTARVKRTAALAAVLAALVAVAWAMWSGINWYTRHTLVVEWVRVIWGSYPRHVHVVPRRYDFHSIWMPRYLGIVWAGFAIAVAGLLMRLPGRAVRGSVIAVLLAVNLVNAVARVWVDPEPPAELAARDVVAANHSHGAQRVYFLPEGRLVFRRAPRGQRATGRFLDMGEFILTGTASPGNGWVLGPVGAYWFAQMGALHLTPQDWRRVAFDQSRVIGGVAGMYTPGGLVALDLMRGGQANRVVTWERGSDGLPDGDAVATVLGPGWTKISDQHWQAWDHWSWRRTCEYRRRVFERRPSKDQK